MNGDVVSGRSGPNFWTLNSVTWVGDASVFIGSEGIFSISNGDAVRFAIRHVCGTLDDHEDSNFEQLNITWNAARSADPPPSRQTR